MLFNLTGRNPLAILGVILQKALITFLFIKRILVERAVGGMKKKDVTRQFDEKGWGRPRERRLLITIDYY